MEKRNKKNKQKGNGEGTLYYSESLQKWIGQYTAKDGTRKTMTQKKNEKATVFKARFNDTLSQVRNGTFIEKAKETAYTILYNYIEQKHNDGITSDRSYLRDTDTFNQIKSTCSNWINKNITDITAEDIEKSKINIRQYSNNSIDKIWTMINKIFIIAISRRKIIYNPMLDETLKKPISIKQTMPIEALTKDEETRLIEILTGIKHKYTNIILLQLYTGARIGEILALTKDCINLSNNTITIYRTITRSYEIEGNKRIERRVLGKHTKTFDKKTGIDKGKRTFPMTKNVQDIISDILTCRIDNKYNLLFYDYIHNSLVCDNSINSFLNRLNKKYNICNGSLHTHKLRHTFITRCQEKGLSLPVIQNLVGHVEGSSITTSIYTSISFDFIYQELQKLMQ